MKCKRGMGFRTAYLGVLAVLFWLPAMAEAAVPLYNQTGYRWRNDDGGESTATWKAEREFAAAFATNKNIRLRLCIDNRNGAQAMGFRLSYTDHLEYDPNSILPEQPWETMNAVATTGQAFEMATSQWFTNGIATTDQLPGTGSFVSGSMVAAPTNISAVTGIVSGQYINVEFCFRATRYAKLHTGYKFRISYAVMGPTPALMLIGRDPLGDVNHDGIVNAADLNEVISNFGQSY